VKRIDILNLNYDKMGGTTHMKKFNLAVKALLVLILALATFTVFAGLSVGFSSAGRGSIIVTLTTKGGFESLQVRVTGEDLFATCTSPGGNNAPGQNPISFSDYASVQSVPNVSGPNTYTLTFNGPLQSTSAEDAGCPNDNWTVSHITGDINIFVRLDEIVGTRGRVTTFDVTCEYDSSVASGTKLICS
jgi:hypothetical protein